MARLIMWNLMTLDGFVEGVNRDLSWHLDVWGEELERAAEARRRADVRPRHLRTDGEWPRASDGVADLMNALPKYVFSRTLKRSDWNNTQVFNAEVSGTVARLRGESTEDIFLFGSADLAASLIPYGLIDEFRIAVNPVVLGGGPPLFKQCERVKLKLLDSKAHSTGIVILCYQR